MKNSKFILATIIIIAMALGLSGVVHALPCSLGFVNGGGTNYICQDGTAGSNNDSTSIINGKLYSVLPVYLISSLLILYNFFLKLSQ